MPRRTIADPLAQAFGAAVRDARNARRETLEDVAARIPSDGRRKQTTMDPRYLGEIELGWHAPSIVTAQRIATALDLQLADLVRGL